MGYIGHLLILMAGTGLGVYGSQRLHRRAQFLQQTGGVLQALLRHTFHGIDLLFMSGQMLVGVFQFRGKGYQGFVHGTDLCLHLFHCRHVPFQSFDPLFVFCQHNIHIDMLICITHNAPSFLLFSAAWTL